MKSRNVLKNINDLRSADRLVTSAKTSDIQSYSFKAQFVHIWNIVVFRFLAMTFVSVEITHRIGKANMVLAVEERQVTINSVLHKLRSAASPVTLGKLGEAPLGASGAMDAVDEFERDEFHACRKREWDYE
ncbi:hypothetical protein L596_025554 [Steinernema carpocapsae]|uniref:Uncharacterized protein n=1 Tax=Steinernema carpocapsae TaxID=34508 RepID=A0A4U5M841_STECR|nr:hypothetical protein L596_025554 [Steinernema carpocapsae]